MGPTLTVATLFTSNKLHGKFWSASQRNRSFLSEKRSLHCEGTRSDVDGRRSGYLLAREANPEQLVRRTDLGEIAAGRHLRIISLSGPSLAMIRDPHVLPHRFPVWRFHRHEGAFGRRKAKQFSKIISRELWHSRHDLRHTAPARVNTSLIGLRRAFLCHDFQIWRILGDLRDGTTFAIALPSSRGSPSAAQCCRRRFRTKSGPTRELEMKH